MWKDIIGYEDIYQINEYGDIRDTETKTTRSPYISNKGYKIIDLYKNGHREKFLIHRLVAIHFIPNPNNLPIVLHKDNVKLNTHYTNLQWGTYSDNNRQAIADGLNKVPRPDNRKYYSIYNDNESIVCYGAKQVIDKIQGTESIVRNLLFRNQNIKNGPYKGYRIKKIDMIKPFTIDI